MINVTKDIKLNKRFNLVVFVERKKGLFIRIAFR